MLSTLTAKHRHLIRHSWIFVLAPSCLLIGLKLTTNLLLAWLGLLASITGCLFSFYVLGKLNHEMNVISELPEKEKPRIAFRIPLIIGSLLLLFNLAGCLYFVKYTYFPSLNNSVSIFVINQSKDTLEDISIQYGQTQRILKQVTPGKSEEVIFPRQKNVPITVRLKADGVERVAEFGMDPRLSMSAIRIDPLKNILPDL